MPERGLDDEPIVLIVDDDADLRKMMVLALHRAGFETRQAGNGDEALALLQAQSVDGVVLDMGMPGLTGTQVVTALRSDPETATLPILLITGSGDEDTVLGALEAGADDFLSKPVRLDELVAPDPGPPPDEERVDEPGRERTARPGGPRRRAGQSGTVVRAGRRRRCAGHRARSEHRLRVRCGPPDG